MTDDTTVLCRRCGFGNRAGDQFCGSCGAFLEWEGQPVDDADVAALAGGAMPRTVEPDADTGTWASRGPAGGSDVGYPAETPSPGAARLDLVRCPACGIANPANRTFCSSCGTTLTGAAAVAEPPPDLIAEAVSRPVGSVRPIVMDAPRASSHRDPTARGGIPGWVFGVAGLGILAGVVLVGGSMLLGALGPGSTVTSAPSTAATAPTVTASPVATEAPTPAVPAEPVKLQVTGASASSVVGNKPEFAPEKVFDSTLRSAWQEGKATEKGQWIEITFAPARVDRLVVRNGYQLSLAAYNGNLRLRDVEVSIDGGDPIAVRLQDTAKAQDVDLGGIEGATTIRITIVNTYASTKTSYPGSPFDDAAVSDLQVFGVPVP